MPKKKDMRPRKAVDTSTYTGRFAVRLKTLREKAGMSVHELADKSGVPLSTLYFWESGTNAPALNDDILSVAEAIGVKIRTLIPEK